MKDNLKVQELSLGIPVVFKNLLEENGEDICCGVVAEDAKIDCKCGCNGVFEEEDVEILDYYADADYSGVKAYSLSQLICKLLPTLNDGCTLTFASSGDTGVNFGIAFQYIFETKVLVSGYWGGYCEEDGTGDIRLFNCSQMDLCGETEWKREVVRQLTDMIINIDKNHKGYVFVKPLADAG